MTSSQTKKANYFLTKIETPTHRDIKASEHRKT
jgi:hypothetical protein